DLAILDAAISPIRRIAPEIMAEILQVCCAQHSKSNPFDHSLDNPLVPPIVLTHVCSFWYTVAMSTPCLW
ncbi:hypothetical protein DFH07DRAFT_721446, partial [Mycena maculata]